MEIKSTTVHMVDMSAHVKNGLVDNETAENFVGRSIQSFCAHITTVYGLESIPFNKTIVKFGTNNLTIKEWEDYGKLFVSEFFLYIHKKNFFKALRTNFSVDLEDEIEDFMQVVTDYINEYNKEEDENTKPVFYKIEGSIYM